MIAKHAVEKKKESTICFLADKIQIYEQNDVSLHRKTIECYHYSIEKVQIINNNKQRIMESLMVNELMPGEEISLLYNICIIW